MNVANAKLINEPVLSTRQKSYLKDKVEKRDFSDNTDDETCSFNLTDSVYTSKFENTSTEESKDEVATEHKTPLKSQF